MAQPDAHHTSANCALSQIAALLSHHIYKSEEARLPPNVEEVDIKAIFQHSDRTLSWIEHAPYSKLYHYHRGDESYYFYAIRGTQDQVDWQENTKQCLGTSNHYLFSACIALVLGINYGDKIIFTGHSKGGGHAALNSMVTGCRAITFNAPGISPKTKQSIVESLRLMINNPSFNLGSDSRIVAYCTEFDPVSLLHKTIHQHTENRNESVFQPTDGQLYIIIKNAPVLSGFLTTAFKLVSQSRDVESFVANSFTALNGALQEEHSIQYILDALNQGHHDKYGSFWVLHQNQTYRQFCGQRMQCFDSYYSSPSLYIKHQPR